MLLWLLYTSSCKLPTANAHVRSESEVLQQWPPHVLFVNLERSPERRTHTEEWLQQQGLEPSAYTRVEAVDARSFNLIVQGGQQAVQLDSTLPPEVSSPNQLLIDTWRFGLEEKLAVLACGLSHAKAIAIAYSMQLEEALVIEDDVRFARLSDRSIASDAELWQYMRSVRSSLPRDWALLQLSLTVFLEKKNIELHRDYEQNSTLWKVKDPCSASEFMIYGTGAYLISRAGMKSFLAEFLPQFLDVDVSTACAFSSHIDLRKRTSTAMADVWLYRLPNVYASLLSLFVPAESVAQTTTVHPNIIHSLLHDPQLQSIQSMLQHAVDSKWITQDRNRMALHRALSSTQFGHAGRWKRLRTDTGMQYAIVLDLGLHGVIPYKIGTQTVHHYAEDISSPEQRKQLFADIRQQEGPATAEFWQMLISTYLDRCGPAQMRSSSHLSQHVRVLEVLIPLQFSLMPVIVPLEASLAQVRESAAQFCYCLQTEQESLICQNVVVRWVLSALQLYV